MCYILQCTGAVIGHVMKSMDDLGANYAAFYGTITRHQNREKVCSKPSSLSTVVLSI